jgi:hypothetical protein
MTTSMTSSSENSASSYQGPTRWTGIALLATGALSIFVMLHHPEVTTKDPNAVIPELVREGPLSGFVHGILMIGVMLTWHGINVFKDKLATLGIDARLANSVHSLGIAGFIGAPLISGFIIPDVAARYSTMPGEAQTVALDLMRLAGLTNRALSKMGTIGIGAAALLFAVLLLRRKGRLRIVGGVGLVFGIGAIATMMVGVSLDVHSMTLVTVAMAVWYGAIGWALLEERLGQS